MNPSFLRRYASLLLALLAGCGGGGSAPPGGDPIADEDPIPSATQVLLDVQEYEDLEEIAGETGATIVEAVEGTTYYVVGLPPGMALEDFLEELDGDVRVVDAERDEGVRFPEGGGGTIPLFSDDPTAVVSIQPELRRIGVDAARSRTRGAGVVIAVVDTGVVPSHPLLAGRVEPGGRDFVGHDDDPTDERNGVDDDRDGLVDEGYGHGTFVASLVLAVAPDARILPLRALGTDATGTASGIAQAIGFAVSHGADAINLSAGLPEDLDLIQQAVQNARDAGVPVFAAAGNRTSNVDFPAFLSEAEAIAAVDVQDRKAPFSSYGSSVDLSAPGVSLIGAHPASPSGTARWSGTSFSTAITTGGFALLRAQRPLDEARDLVRRLEDTSVPIDARNPAYSGRLGRGRIDLDAATR